MERFLIVKCDELKDQYECDCNRTPIKIVYDLEREDIMGCEVYEILPDGSIGGKVKQYDEPIEQGYCVWELPEGIDGYEEPEKIVVLQKIKSDLEPKDFAETSTFKKWYGRYIAKYAEEDESLNDNNKTIEEQVKEEFCREEVYSVYNEGTATMYGIGYYKDKNIELGY